MNNYITAEIDENRCLTFGEGVIYAGEQGSEILKIPVDYWENADMDYYVLIFENSPVGTRFSSGIITAETTSPAYISEGFIFCPLTFDMTKTGRLKIQLEAHKTVNEKEIVEKTSVAALTAEPSLGDAYASEAERVSIYGDIKELFEKVEELSGKIADVDYDYFCAAAGARLFFESKETTPVYFPKDGDEAEALMDEILDTLEPGSGVNYYIVCPGDDTVVASLGIIMSGGESVTVGRYHGRALLDILRNGGVSNE